MSGKVSIIVRTMGRPELSRALDSLRAQTWKDLEIVLVVANPAFDATQLAAANIRIVAPGTKLIRPLACNAGLDAATGQWIGFLDEDDWLEPDHIACLMAALTAPGAPLLAYSDMLAHEGGREVVSSTGYWKRQFAEHPVFWIVTALFSRRLVDEFGCRFDADFVLLEDWDFFVQCAEWTDCLHVPGVTAHYAASAGESGGGAGVNRDDARLKPYIERMSAKWGMRYGSLIASADDALAQAKTAMEQARWNEAESLLMRGLQADPGHPALLNRLALCRRQAGDWPGVLAALRRACDSDRGAFPLYADYALVAHKLGSAEEARAALANLQSLARSPQETTRAAQVAAVINAA